MRLKTPPREQIKSWLLAIIENSSETPTDIARRAGIATTTVTRFLNDPDHTGTLSPSTIRKIALTQGVQPPEGVKLKPASMKNSVLSTGQQNFSEGEGTPYILPEKAKTQTLEQQAVSLVLASHKNVTPWRLKADSLSAIGYMRNDILFVDIARQPKANDIVCAQHYNWQQGTAQTLFRLYRPPYLMGASLTNPAIQPLFADDENNSIKGVVISSMRF